MSDAYDTKLQDILLDCAISMDLESVIRPNSTYCYVAGPAYESRAECRFLRLIGGDLVGMSTIPETVVAKQCNMAILGLSLVTNEVVVEIDENTVHASHADVLEAVRISGKNVEKLVKIFVSKDKLQSYLTTLPAVPVRDIITRKYDNTDKVHWLFLASLALMTFTAALFISKKH